MEIVARATDLGAMASIRTVRHAFTALMAGDAGGVDDFIDPRYLDHEHRGDGDGRPEDGLARFRLSVRWLHRVFADLEFEEQEVIAADDRVVVRGVMRATHVGELLGIAPTGRRIEVHQIHIFRLAGERIVEHRTMWGEISLLSQLHAALIG